MAKARLEIYEISEQLIEASEKWETKSLELAKLEIEYQNTCDSILMGDSAMGLSSQPLREAYVRKVMQTDHEQLFVKYTSLSLEVRLLANRIKVLSVISSNLRSLGYKNTE